MTEIDFGTLKEWALEAEDNCQDANEIAEKCRDYYDSKQLSDAEVRALKKRKQAPVVMNRIKPKMDTLMGLEKTAKTTVKAFPRTPKHEKAATAATEGIRFVLQDNFFDQVRSIAWEFLLIEGTCGAEVIVRKKDGKIQINPLFWDRIIYDPYSRRKDFSDARYKGQVVWMDYDEALAKFPDGGDVLEATQSSTSTYDDKPRWMDVKRKRVKIVELYYRWDNEVYYACFTGGGFLKSPQISPYINEEGETEDPYELASLFVDREGGRYGAVKQLLDVQDEINKRRSKALHLMSVRQVMLEKGAVDDVNKVRQELAKPDGVVEVTPGMLFEVLKTGDMAAAQFNLLTEAKQEIDSVGANAAVQGKDNRAISGRALLERKEAGQTEIGPMFDVLKHWQYRIFRKIYNRIKQYWKDEKWVRVTDDENNLRWVGLNKPITKGEQVLQAAQEKGLPDEQLQMLAQQIEQDPMMQEVVGTENDIADLDVDLVLTDVPDSVTMQVEEFQVLGEMVKSGVPIPPKAIIEASSLSHKDRILAEMGQQIPPEIQEKFKSLQEEAQKLAQENQQLKAKQQETMMKLEGRAKEKQTEAQLEQMQMVMTAKIEQQSKDAELRQQAMDKKMEMAFDRWEALLKAKTQIEVAQISAGAELQKAQITETAVQ